MSRRTSWSTLWAAAAGCRFALPLCRRRLEALGLKPTLRMDRDTFGIVKAAQARGDLEVLQERGRRVLRVHLDKDVKAGLALLRRAVGA